MFEAQICSKFLIFCSFPAVLRSHIYRFHAGIIIAYLGIGIQSTGLIENYGKAAVEIIFTNLSVSAGT